MGILLSTCVQYGQFLNCKIFELEDKNCCILIKVDKNKFFKSDGKLKCYHCFSKRRNSLSVGSVCPACNKVSNIWNITVTFLSFLCHITMVWHKSDTVICVDCFIFFSICKSLRWSYKHSNNFRMYKNINSCIVGVRPFTRDKLHCITRHWNSWKAVYQCYKSTILNSLRSLRILLFFCSKFLEHFN